MPLIEIVKKVEAVIRAFYRKAPSDQTGVEWSEFKGSGIWWQPGASLVGLIEDLMKVKRSVAESVCDLLEYLGLVSADDDVGYEAGQLRDCKFVESVMFPDVVRYDEFQKFQQRLKYQARFFHPQSRAVLASVFEGVDGLVTDSGSPVAVRVKKATDSFGTLYRARVFQNDAALRRALVSPDRELGPPPSSMARAGRMNAANIALFYGATSPETALAEVRPPAHSRVLVGKFQVLKELLLLDVAALNTVVVQSSKFDPKHRDRLLHAGFLRLVSSRISRPVLPEHQDGEYLITQAIADYLAYESRPRFNGMIYPSTQSSEGVNVVLFHHSSRVEPLPIAPTSRFDAELTRSTEDGPEPEYYVVEWTNEVPERTQDCSHSDLSEEPVFGESREATLRLLSNEISVHHAEKIFYETSIHNVSRHKRDRHGEKYSKKRAG